MMHYTRRILVPLWVFLPDCCSVKKGRVLRMVLLRHANMNFRDQVVYLTGHAYERCQFTRCTFVVQGTGETALIDCTFVGCVWHLDVMFHDQTQLEELERTFIPMMRASVPMVAPEPATHSPA